jgi:RNA polymerase sigma-70 factor (ECF subfamily)
MRKHGVRDDRADFAAFYEQSRDACLRAVAVSASDAGAAEDLVAEAYARAWARWQHVSRHPAPTAWVVRTALNARVSWWRRRRREVEWTDHDQPAADSPHRLLDSTLLAALRSLPARQREVIALRVLLDLDTETTARALGIAPGTVTAHLARATAALRQGAPRDPRHPAPMEVTR